MEEGCSLPKEQPSHRCVWHRLLKEPIEVQVQAAHARLTAVPEEARLSRVADYLWPAGQRFCAACQSFIPTFYASGSQCRACASKASHGYSIKREFGITSEEYNALLELQGGVCGICGQRPVSKRLAVDHDHATGAVRGLLCSRDNHDLLGAGHDNVDRLRAAVVYLDNPPMSGHFVRPGPNKRRPVSRTDRAETDPTYLMHDHDRVSEPLPTILQQVVKRMTVDQLVLSGGMSDPETGVYWLAYRQADAERPPWETAEPPQPAGRVTDDGGSDTELLRPPSFRKVTSV